MAAVAMVTKVQTMLNSLRTADPFETWPKNRSSFKVVLFVFKIFKMAANIKKKLRTNFWRKKERRRRIIIRITRYDMI
jgi:hypothetical protein